MSQTWTFNSMEFEVDLQDADFAARYEDAFGRLGEEEKKIQKTGKSSELIRQYCGMYHRLFDDIYGDGTSEKLFAGRTNAALCEQAYASFMDAAVRCGQEAAQRRSQMMARYAPRQNRQQRRYGEHGGRKQ